MVELLQTEICSECTDCGPVGKIVATFVDGHVGAPAACPDCCFFFIAQIDQPTNLHKELIRALRVTFEPGVSPFPVAGIIH
jgi:hypothetical protein